MQHSTSRQYSSTVTCHRDGQRRRGLLMRSRDVRPGAPLIRKAPTEILPVHFVYLIDVVACDVRGLRGGPRGVAGHCNGEPTCASGIPPAMSRTFYNTNAMRVSGPC